MPNPVYRIISGNCGIYEAVDKVCPKNDPRRNAKPDGSWLQKAGKRHPGAISFWTKAGLEHYISSGLFSWHKEIVIEPIFVLVGEQPMDVLYEDKYQIICDPDAVIITTKMTVSDFLKNYSP